MAFAAGAASEAVSLNTSKGGMFLQGAEVKLPAASWTIGYHWVKSFGLSQKFLKQFLSYWLRERAAWHRSE